VKSIDQFRTDDTFNDGAKIRMKTETDACMPETTLFEDTINFYEIILYLSNWLTASLSIVIVKKIF
jgi:hypothetical protein